MNTGIINNLFDVSREYFIENHLEKKSLYNRTGNAEDIFKIEDFPSVLVRAIERPDLINLVKDGVNLQTPVKKMAV